MKKSSKITMILVIMLLTIGNIIGWYGYSSQRNIVSYMETTNYIDHFSGDSVLDYLEASYIIEHGAEETLEYNEFMKAVQLLKQQLQNNRAK